MEKKKFIVISGLLAVIACSLIVLTGHQIKVHNEEVQNKKVQEMASYLNTIPSMLDIMCNTDEGSYFIPNDKEREAICTYDVRKVYNYNKEQQEKASSSEDEVKESTETESTESNAEGGTASSSAE